MFPKQSKNALFNNLAAGWKKGQAEAAAGKLPVEGAKSAMPKNLPGLMKAADGLPPAVEGPSAPMAMPGAPAPMPSPAAAAPHPMMPMPHNPMLKKSPWMGMKSGY